MKNKSCCNVPNLSQMWIWPPGSGSSHLLLESTEYYSTYITVYLTRIQAYFSVEKKNYPLQSSFYDYHKEVPM
jgi:hypothetical protein